MNHSELKTARFAICVFPVVRRALLEMKINESYSKVGKTRYRGLACPPPTHRPETRALPGPPSEPRPGLPFPPGISAQLRAQPGVLTRTSHSGVLFLLCHAPRAHARLPTSEIPLLLLRVLTALSSHGLGFFPRLTFQLGFKCTPPATAWPLPSFATCAASGAPELDPAMPRVRYGIRQAARVIQHPLILHRRCKRRKPCAAAAEAGTPTRLPSRCTT